jgi:hypothetical protein
VNLSANLADLLNGKSWFWLCWVAFDLFIFFFFFLWRWSCRDCSWWGLRLTRFRFLWEGIYGNGERHEILVSILGRQGFSRHLQFF